MHTFKFYTSKGERLGIFLTKEENSSVIKVYRCSLDDQFSKKVAREAAENGYLLVPEKSPFNGLKEGTLKKLLGLFMSRLPVEIPTEEVDLQTFSREMRKGILVKEEVHPQIYHFDEVLSNKEFFQFCRDHFYTKRNVVRKAECTILVDGKGRSKTLSIKELHRMDDRVSFPVVLDRTK